MNTVTMPETQQDDPHWPLGFTFMINNGVVAWCSQKQKPVALLTTEENIALSRAVQELT